MTDQIAGWMPTAGVDKIIEHARREGFAAGAAQAAGTNPHGPLTPTGERVWQEGFAAGIEAAAQEGKAAMLALWFGEADIEKVIAEKVIARIRALRPPTAHDSDCALHNAPALPVGPCDCSASAPAGAPLPEPMTVDLDIPRDPAERERVRLASLNLCQCPDCGRMHKPLGFNKPSAPAGAPSEEDVARVAQIALQTWRNGKGWNEVVRQVYLALLRGSSDER